MAETAQQIDARFRNEHPFATARTATNGVERQMTSVEYEAVVANAVASVLAQQTAAVEVQLDQDQRDQMKLAYQSLKAGTATNAQVQKVVAWLLREQAGGLPR